MLRVGADADAEHPLSCICAFVCVCVRAYARARALSLVLMLLFLLICYSTRWLAGSLAWLSCFACNAGESCFTWTVWQTHWRAHWWPPGPQPDSLVRACSPGCSDWRPIAVSRRRRQLQWRDLKVVKGGILYSCCFLLGYFLFAFGILLLFSYFFGFLFALFCVFCFVVCKRTKY